VTFDTLQPEMPDPSRIVVGVDGSEPSLAALQFAAAEATVRGARLRVVSVWRLDGSESGEVTLRDQVADSRRAADDAIARARHELDKDWPAVEADAEAIEGGLPADMLLDESEQSALLVVGNRGHGGLGTLLLGSVSEHIVRNARCPVVVIPHGWAEPDATSHQT